ncbi:DUF6066 family protein [Myxococcota bacterium]|nr:DUF6066 family protein [Myxococcota bacterium]
MLPSLGHLVLVLAIGAPSYGTLKTDAEPVTNLGRFLERYLGDCDSDDPTFDKKGCEAAVAQAQKRWADKVLVFELDDVSEQLHFAEWDTNKRAFRLHLTPFFGERALALTVGKPERLNADGLPVLKNLPVWVPSPNGSGDLSFRRQLERGMVRLELLVKVKKPWRMKKKGEDGEYRGLDVALVGLRVYSLQGNNVLAEQTY